MEMLLSLVLVIVEVLNVTPGVDAVAAVVAADVEVVPQHVVRKQRHVLETARSVTHFENSILLRKWKSIHLAWLLPGTPQSRQLLERTRLCQMAMPRIKLVSSSLRFHIFQY